MVLTKTFLVSRNSRDKIQVAIATLSQQGATFLIDRQTGQHKGKMTDQPTLIIEKGKVKRTAFQQAELEYKSIVSKYLDKGYKDLSTLTLTNFHDLTVEELNKLVPTIKSDASGELKPMLAKDYNKCQNSVLQKPLWASKKLNGVRMMVRYDVNQNRVITISRGGKNYDVAASLITEELKEMFKQHPENNLILDGELYVHGLPLQTISGIARLETFEPRCEKLEYWIYDIASDQLTFEERNELLLDLEDVFINSEKIKILRHVKTESWADIQRLHDKWVAEGFEGVVVRKPDKVYEPGKRTSTMIKVKAYQDAEFKIVGFSEKLRDEDFCFVCETSKGKRFEAKPIGSREIKDQYLEDMDDIIGRMGTVKFFEWSTDGIPLQPVFQSVRYDLDD